MDVRSVPQDAAVQLVQRSVDKVTLLVEKDAEQQFKNSEFYSLVRNSLFILKKLALIFQVRRIYRDGPSLSLNQCEKRFSCLSLGTKVLPMLL